MPWCPCLHIILIDTYTRDSRNNSCVGLPPGGGWGQIPQSKDPWQNLYGPNLQTLRRGRVRSNSLLLPTPCKFLIPSSCRLPDTAMRMSKSRLDNACAKCVTRQRLIACLLVSLVYFFKRMHAHAHNHSRPHTESDGLASSRYG
jgi:hypothetical protein